MVSVAVHDQPSEDVDDQVPPLQAYRAQTSTVVPDGTPVTVSPEPDPVSNHEKGVAPRHFSIC